MNTKLKYGQKKGEVLVAIINNKKDFDIISNKNWYRIPVISVQKWLIGRWPPEWLAFYQTKIFGAQAYSIRYYARVINIRKAYRNELFPSELPNEKSNKQYYQINLFPLQQLPKPIFSRRFRRIVFIPTNWQKFSTALEINDLYDESPLENRLWAALKRHNIPAERQEFVTVRKNNYFLDFNIYCSDGKLDIEANGDSWHANPKKSVEDNFRNNALTSSGWRVLRFSTHEIQKDLEEYCIPEISKTINTLGGVEEGRSFPRKINAKFNGSYQMDIFDV
ncbi:MAG: DUF559 domain-containing protein [Candidatus Cloacimonadota bacterium]|nr:DUF559 domain-containing protein [Candidatus Cloacimonadota bacterium]